jgi:hypothetical protein
VEIPVRQNLLSMMCSGKKRIIGHNMPPGTAALSRSNDDANLKELLIVNRSVVRRKVGGGKETRYQARRATAEDRFMRQNVRSEQEE